MGCMPVGALDTDKAAFHDGDAQAALGQRAGAELPRGATAEDDDAIVTVPVDAAHIDLRTSGAGATAPPGAGSSFDFVLRQACATNAGIAPVECPGPLAVRSQGISRVFERAERFGGSCVS